MSGKDTSEKQQSAARIREERLKQALKANLARRKAQARVRGGGKAGKDSAPGKGGEQEG
ncbi:hypothetical protein [Roseovarius aquimarinus]|uniref:Uncharacterized protein n=1 Tax=Roseovarius aquimarinus TaxID=1229156 RepID=A0ABW7I5U5_9RHOB